VLSDIATFQGRDDGNEGNAETGRWGEEVMQHADVFWSSGVEG
jgi:hypothetical protein